MLEFVLILQTNLHLAEAVGLVLEFYVAWAVMNLFLVFFQQLFVSLEGTLLNDLPEA